MPKTLTAVRLAVDRIPTPVGEMVIVVDDLGDLRAADWADHEPRMMHLLGIQYRDRQLRFEPTHNPDCLSEIITAYFHGELHAIDTLPVNPSGTPFQDEVWRSLRRIPCGTTLSYKRLAEIIGRPSAIRAVGLANGSNPISVVVPCHRLIGSNGSLTGYGGGIERKRWLLNHERVPGF